MTDTNGIVTIPSKHSVDETVARLEHILQEKGIKLFALVDHSGEAERAGMKMPPTKVAIFGSPKAGTPLMLATADHSHRSASEAIDRRRHERERLRFLELSRLSCRAAWIAA